MQIVQRITGDGLRDMKEIAKLLGSSKARIVYRRGINHTGNKGFTQVKRTLAKQVGLPQGQVVSRGALQKIPATNASLEFIISSRGGFIPLKDFKAGQFKKGVKASPWGQRRLFKSAFIVKSLGGNVFKRVDKSRLPIEKLWGPAIPREMVKNETAAAFKNVSKDLHKRVDHELRRATGGRLS